jgi:hypothetical protein
MFETNVVTLLSCPGSYFGGLINSGTNLGQELFIDRDPTLFRHVLAYMR